jgi:hypothetical protein
MNFDKTGIMVSDRASDVISAIMIVIGISLINSPSTPVKNANGKNTSTVVNVPAKLAAPIFLTATFTASSGVRFLLLLATIDSTTIIEPIPMEEGIIL